MGERADQSIRTTRAESKGAQRSGATYPLEFELCRTQRDRDTGCVSSDERELRLAWQRHVDPGADAQFEAVVARHREPGRRYHDVRHVRWVVRHSCDLAARFDLPEAAVDEIVAAAFFHDAIYDVTRPDNEAASARLSAKVLDELGWTAPAVAHVVAMIESTAGHTETDDPATAVLLAADLGVLAAEPSRYVEYTLGVRDEYAHLDDDAWAVGRAAFIRSLLDRDHIFPEVLALDAWERRARANLTAELAMLE